MLSYRLQHPVTSIGAIVALTTLLSSCTSVVTRDYEATALVTYTWRVEYSKLGEDRRPRIEKFASTSLLNRNGVEPDGAVTGPDDRGLWWPALPPRPTVDAIEARIQGSQEEAGRPLLHKSVRYELTYTANGTGVTLPTNYDVYRAAVKAYPNQIPLELVLGIGDRSIEKAVPVSSSQSQQ